MRFLLFVVVMWQSSMVFGANEFLVKIKPNLFSAFNSSLIKQKIRDDLFVVDQKNLQSLRNSEAVEYIEPNHKIYPYSQPDDLVRQQWWLKNKEGLDLSPLGAWAITTGSHDVVVAVLDTGVDFKHPDLKNNIWVNEAEILGVNGVDDDGNGYIDDFRGWSFYPDDNDTFDYRGHGTHVSGIIGAEGNNGVGVAGVNWRVSIMGLNIFPRYIEGRVSDAIRGIDYAIDKKAHIINASWGAGPGDITEDEFRALREAIERAEQAGILFVAAAGNSGKSNETKGDIPASFGLKNIISVGSFNRRTKASEFSNFGSTSVHVFAPGEEIYSTLPKGRYGYKSGTSMAAPMIAGIAALMMARDLSVSGFEIKELLLDSCVEAPKLATLSKCQGAISAEKAITDLEAFIK